MSDTPSNPLIKVGAVSLIVLVIAIALSYFILGVGAALNIAKIVFVILIIVSILGLVIGALVYLFSKKKIDSLQSRNDAIISSCKSSKIPYKQELYFRGNQYITTRRVGSIIGYSMITSAPTKVVKKDKKGNEYLCSEGEPTRQVLMIAYRDSIFSAIGLGKIKIFSGIEEDIHGGFKSLASQRVYLNGTTFGPLIHGMYFLSRRWGDTALIDETTKDDVFRYNFEEYLRESKSIFDSAINLDQQFVKHREITNVEQLPIQQR